MGYKRVARSQARASCARPSRGAAPQSRRAASGLGDAGAAQLSGDHATRGRKEGNAGFAPGWDAPKGMATHSSILGSEKSVDRGAWWATVHGVTKSWTWWSDEHSVSLLISTGSLLTTTFMTPGF